MRITELLTQDHRAVHEMFLELEGLPEGSGRRSLFDRIVEELDVHARAEEAVFYPAVREASRRVDDAEAGHEHLRSVIAQVQRADPASPDFSLMVRLVQRIVLGHVMEEESGIFLDAGRMGPEALERLGAEFQARKEALKRDRPRKVA
jgi:hemerythrin superfamily protein